MLKYLSYAYSIETDTIIIYGLNDTGKRTQVVKISCPNIGTKDTGTIHNMVKTIMGVLDRDLRTRLARTRLSCSKLALVRTSRIA